jgi:hypothetical protein
VWLDNDGCLRAGEEKKRKESRERRVFSKRFSVELKLNLASACPDELAKAE